MEKKRLLKGYSLVIFSALLFGCMPLITRYIYAEGVNRESVVLLRNLLALPILAVLTWRQDRSFKIPVKAIPTVSAIALAGCCVTPLLLYGSYQYIATGVATVFHFVYPAVVVLMGLLFLKKKVRKGTVFAILLCIVGICFFYDPAEPLNLTGVILALSSGLTYGIYVVLLSIFRHQAVSGFKLSFYISVVCSVVMLIVCVVSGLITVPATPAGWLWCMVLALVVNVGAVVAFQVGTFIIGGERASILSTVEPLTGVVIGAAVFDERITGFTGIGVALVMAACILIAVTDKKQKT